jgi:hypothetical protein
MASKPVSAANGPGGCIECDRRYNSQCITFIASKNDDVSCKEIITALKLRKDPALIAIDARISDIETKKKDLDRRYSKKQADITGNTFL